MTDDFFGIVPMLDGMATEGAFVTTSRCRLLKLFRGDFHRLETTNPEIAAHIRTTAARRRARRTSTNLLVDRAQGRGGGQV
jgi:CRP-like cAMP-binding protein